MNKIMIVGCPGSGKSTLSKKIGNKLDIPVLHLDYIYHIDNFQHISRDVLKEMVESFVTNNERFIIDGNYGGTMEWRLQFCDTVILLDIDTEICVNNVLARMSEEDREDMAPGFDNSIMDENFLDFVRNFRNDKIPDIKDMLKYSNVETYVIENYSQMQLFLDNIK